MPNSGTWKLIAAAAAAVVTVSAAGFVMAGSSESSVKKITGTQDGTPGLAWSFDAAEYKNRPFADFSDPRGGATYGAGNPGFTMFGDTAVTLLGIPNRAGGLDDAVMIGIDAENGSVVWESPAGDVEQCSVDEAAGRIVCYAMGDDYSIVSYDVDTGEATRRDLEEPVFAVASDSGVLYVVEGNAEDNDVRLHSGTVDDISANWTRAFDVGGAWESVFGYDVVTVRNGVGLLQVGGSLVQIEVADGSTLWSSDPDGYFYGTMFDDGSVTYTDEESGAAILRGSDGQILVEADGSTSVLPHVRDGDDAPMVSGDSAYDRTTGELLWTSDVLTEGGNGALQAIVGDIGYVSAQGISAGIDLNTGEELWRVTTSGEAAIPRCRSRVAGRAESAGRVARSRCRRTPDRRHDR